MAMKVHPMPGRRSITLQYGIASARSRANAVACLQKKLRRLPHIFAKVLELPIHSDADVSVEETSDEFRFVVIADDVGDDVRAHTVEFHPGIIKIVIRENYSSSSVLDLSVDDLELDLWRFRLPASTRPELASAVYSDGELVVTVPKGIEEDVSGDGNRGRVWGEGEAAAAGDMGRLVLVQ